jgi:hypothetical protein
MKTLAVFAAALLLGASAASAQIIPPAPRVEVRPWAGARFPTGPQRDLFRTAPVYGVQAAIEMTPKLHLLGSFGWSPGHSKLDVGDRGVDVFQYDLGAEYNIVVPVARSWDLKPFAGVGAGARTYRYDAEDLATNSPLTAYGSFGTELQRGFAAVRVESRGYLFGFTDPMTDVWDARNEVGLSLGFAYHFPTR